ncbi:TPA: hypothetical protein LET59_002980, partial [Listeria monocytogenes]|nr:hypothetical protein [Listeria monocytogenes]
MNWRKKRDICNENPVIQEIKKYNRVRLFLYLIGTVALIGWIIWVLKSFYSIYEICVLEFISSVSEFGLFGSAESTQKQLMSLSFIILILIIMATTPYLYIDMTENSLLTIVIAVMLPCSFISFIFTLFSNDFSTFVKIFAIIIPYTILLRIYFEQQDRIIKLAHNNSYSNKTIISFNLEEVLHAGDAIFAVHNEWKDYLIEVEEKSKIVEDYTESPPGKFEYFCWEKTFKYKLIGLKKTYKKEIIILPKHKYFELISELKMKYPAFEYKTDETHV